MRAEESPTDAGTDPAVSTTESALVVLEALLDDEGDDEIEVFEVEELIELEVIEDEDGVGLGLEVVEGGGGGVEVGVGVGWGREVVVGAGGG